MAKTATAGAAAKTARAKAAGAGKTPAKAAARTAAKTAKAAPARKPVAVKPAAAKRAATPAAKAAKAAAKAVARPVAAKPAARPAAKPAAKPASGTRSARSAEAPRPEAAQVRPTLVRDSFTMPEQEYAVLGAVKQACLKAGFEVKKSELLRAGVALLGQLDVASLRAVLGSLPQLKTGRPPAE